MFILGKEMTNTCPSCKLSREEKIIKRIQLIYPNYLLLLKERDERKIKLHKRSLDNNLKNLSPSPVKREAIKRIIQMHYDDPFEDLSKLIIAKLNEL